MKIQAYKEKIKEINSEEYEKYLEQKEKMNFDIIVERKKEEESILEDGTKQIKTIFESVNLTKKINATAEILKNENGKAKLEELAEKIANSIKNS